MKTTIKATVSVFSLPALLSATLLTTALVSAPAQAENPFWKEGVTQQRYSITVYHSSTCGCCKGWVKHLKDHNFDVTSVEVDDVMPYKAKLGVPRQGASCHTAEVNGKVIEGHVPASDIKRLLASKNDVRLLTVPGMPSGGPGMDMPGAPKDAFKVFAVSKDDKVSVFKQYENY